MSSYSSLGVVICASMSGGQRLLAGRSVVGRSDWSCGQRLLARSLGHPGPSRGIYLYELNPGRMRFGFHRSEDSKQLELLFMLFLCTSSFGSTIIGVGVKVVVWVLQNM